MMLKGRKEWRNYLDNPRKRICWFEIIWICRCPEEWNWYILAFVFLSLFLSLFFFFFFLFFFLYGNTFCHGLVVLTLVLRSSLFQNAKSRIQLTRRIARGGCCCCCWSDASALLMKRAVSQLTLHPSVEVRRIRDVSGGSWR